MIVNGSVFKFGDNIDIDVIILVRYLNIVDYKELVMYCMEDIDDKFIFKVKKGDIIVVIKNFGCGLLREYVLIVIKESGVFCVIVFIFVRIFFRNFINIGFFIFECEEVVNNIDEGDNIEVDFFIGVIKNIIKGKEYKVELFFEFM